MGLGTYLVIAVPSLPPQCFMSIEAFLPTSIFVRVYHPLLLAAWRVKEKSGTFLSPDFSYG
jgi:hypothetical protein